MGNPFLCPRRGHGNLSIFTLIIGTVTPLIVLIQPAEAMYIEHVNYFLPTSHPSRPVDESIGRTYKQLNSSNPLIDIDNDLEDVARIVKLSPKDAEYWTAPVISPQAMPSYNWQHKQWYNVLSHVCLVQVLEALSKFYSQSLPLCFLLY